MYPRGRQAPPACSDPCLFNVQPWKTDTATRRLPSSSREAGTSCTLTLLTLEILTAGTAPDALSAGADAGADAVARWQAAGGARALPGGGHKLRPACPAVGCLGQCGGAQQSHDYNLPGGGHRSSPACPQQCVGTISKLHWCRCMPRCGLPGPMWRCATL